ncbi:unnamed protein product [Urochloa decumbens]|uniref:Protein kinase domain-containing protein n=1 Tax=Urochloa decumbens TaxID=240449 RepID=A0ABC8WAX3_9POAL
MDDAGSCSKPETSFLLESLPKELPAEFLKEITDGFSPDRELGKGVFGTVYRGTLKDGTEIAVKKIGSGSPVTPDKQFQNEVGNLMAVRHDNIVKLVGFCYETKRTVVEHNGRYILADTVESLLCYEYMKMGSLDKHIFAPSTLDWATRFKIIKGICQGLHFLHKGMDKPMLHMDLKPDNILLDENMAPKIADFGLSRLFGTEQTRMHTLNVVGAHGYMAPEYLYRGEISTQLDIYSLGLLIIEITTGERNQRSKDDMSARNLVENVRQNWTIEYIVSKYSSLDANSLQQLKVCIEIGLECVEIDRKKRPSIEHIVNKLDGRL